jgi:hypothetical protein
MSALRKALASTVDPTQIQNPSQIPPPGSQFAGQSAQKLVDVYFGTLAGDIDAQPAAKELLGSAPDTGSLSNADYIYTQVSALYGGVDLPSFQSPSGNTVKSVVFVSGSSQGGYGAFHIEGQSQADFDRIVVDSLTATGNYSAGSGLGAALAREAFKAPHLFPKYRGASDLLEIVRTDDARQKKPKTAALIEALKMATQSSLALRSALETRNPAVPPPSMPSHLAGEWAKSDHEHLIRRLVQANQDLLSLAGALAKASAGRQYLSSALFAAEIVESFQTLTQKANPGLTDGEAVSRVLAFKLAPEIALVPGFSSAVAQKWWTDGHPDFINDNSQNDQSVDGNGAGVMFLLFLTDYLGVPMDRILKYMPATGGVPLGQTYVALLKDFRDLAQVAGQDGASAFQKMVSLLQQNSQNPDGSLNLPANGNPFPSIPGAKQGGLFAGQTSSPGSLAQDVQAAIGLQVQLEQQFLSLKAAVRQIQGDLSGNPAPSALRTRARWEAVAAVKAAAFGYGPPLAAPLVAGLEQRVAPYRAPQYDQTLQDEFWKHVYNELPGSGPYTDRLQVITGTNQAPVAIQITGTINTTKPEPDGDLHIHFQPDDPNFPTNQGSGESPLEIEIIYAGPVTQADAKQAQAGFKNPFDISQLGPGTRIQAAGPFIFDRAHGKPAPDGENANSGLEIHPLVGMTTLATSPVGTPQAPQAPPTSAGQLSADVSSALGQAGALGQTLGNLNALLQKIKEETPTG